MFEMGLFDFGRRTLSSGARPPFEGFYIYALLGLMAYFAADLTVLYMRPKMLPTKPPPQRPSVQDRIENKDLSQYSSILRKNIFNADGKVPPPLRGAQEGSGEVDGDPVLTQLPIKLEGTLVHADPKKSIATVLIQSKNQNLSFMAEDDMEGLGKVVRIERRKLIFRNSSNQRLEYVEIPKDSNIAFGAKNTAAAEAGGGIQQSGDFNFTVSRAEVEKQLENMGAVLNQARMVPNIVPGTGGRVQGFRFVSIQPNSIFTTLGFKPGDVISSVQGEPVNSPTKAMELYNALRTENNIKITINRNGREETLQYNVK